MMERDHAVETEALEGLVPYRPPCLSRIPLPPLGGSQHPAELHVLGRDVVPGRSSCILGETKPGAGLLQHDPAPAKSQQARTRERPLEAFLGLLRENVPSGLQ